MHSSPTPSTALLTPSPAASRSTSPARDDGYESPYPRSGSLLGLLRKLDRDSPQQAKTKFSFLQVCRSKIAIIFLALALALASLTLLGIILDLKLNPSRKPSAKPTAASFAVIPTAFADPCIIQHPENGTYFAFATRTLDHRYNIPLASTFSSGLSEWISPDTDALPRLGAWVASPEQLEDTQVWAPSVAFLPNLSSTNGPGYVMFYSALHTNQTRRHCVGSATSPSIAGPYTPAEMPLVCDFEYGGVIDPSYFYDPITQSSWLIYKRDGNAIGAGGACGNTAIVGGTGRNRDTSVMAVQLDEDDRSKAKDGGVAKMLVNNEPKDGPNLESPVVWFLKSDIGGGGGVYHLLMNAGCFQDSSYRIEHAHCVASAGGLSECTWNRSAQPLLKSGDVLTSTLPDGDGNGFQSFEVTGPGGPGVTNPTAFRQGSPANTSQSSTIGAAKQEYLIFHAELNPLWFGHEHVEYAEAVERGWDRRRGLMIAELFYEGDGTSLSLGRVVAPRAAVEL